MLALVEQRDCVLTKDELLQRIWGDTVVEEGGLTRNISILRKALGESPDDHRYIVTVPGRGYRFVADARSWASWSGMIAALVAAYKGLNAKGGPKGVGDAVNQSVVISFMLLFLTNFIITAVYFQIVPQKGG